MAVIYNEQDIYGITSQGKKIVIGKFKNKDENALRVGGKIFHIVDGDNGATYHFYDAYGNELTDIQVGDSPYAYTVTGTPTADKYYAFYGTAYTSKTWTYQSGGSWVYESCGTTDGVGTGKTNTALMMAKSDGAYANYLNTIWNTLATMRTNSVGGCNDWFVPSKAELTLMKTCTDREGNALTTLFTNNHIWSSFEYNANGAWSWYYGRQAFNTSYKNGGFSFCAARAF